MIRDSVVMAVNAVFFVVVAVVGLLNAALGSILAVKAIRQL